MWHKFLLYIYVYIWTYLEASLSHLETAVMVFSQIFPYYIMLDCMHPWHEISSNNYCSRNLTCVSQITWENWTSLKVVATAPGLLIKVDNYWKKCWNLCMWKDSRNLNSKKKWKKKSIMKKENVIYVKKINPPQKTKKS